MKNFIVFISVIVIWTSTCSYETTVYEGGVSGGSLFYRGNTGSKSAWEGSWQSKQVRYPTDGGYLGPIGYLKVVNNMDSSYSTATIKGGGVGYNYVTFEFYAPAFRGYDYTVEEV